MDDSTGYNSMTHEIKIYEDLVGGFDQPILQDKE